MSLSAVQNCDHGLVDFSWVNGVNIEFAMFRSRSAQVVLFQWLFRRALRMYSLALFRASSKELLNQLLQLCSQVIYLVVYFCCLGVLSPRRRAKLHVARMTLRSLNQV